MLPVNAIKDAVDKLSNNRETKQEFIDKLEEIFDQYPDQASELIALVKEEIANTSLKKPVRTEVLTLLQTKNLSIINTQEQNKTSKHYKNFKYDFLNEFLESSQSVSTELRPGVIIRDTYQLETQLGAGGMGEVWKATHLIQDAAETSESDRYVAIKFLNTDFRSHPDALKTLAREFSYSRKLIHPNIVQVFELNYSGNQVYIAMEYLIGDPLDKWIKNHPHGISLESAVPIIQGICDALVFSHSHEFIHLDIKPSNIIYDPHTKIVKVIDFGIARHANPINRDKTGFDLGELNAVTGAYASIEMLHCVNPDPRDDIYGLACITYELLSGKHPYAKSPADSVLSSGIKPQPVAGLNMLQNKILSLGLEPLRKKRISNVGKFRNGLLSKYIEKQTTEKLSGRFMAIILLIVCAIWLTPKFINHIFDIHYDPVRKGILSGNEASAQKLFDSSKEDQHKILSENKIISALLDIYTKNTGDDPIHEFKTLPPAIQKKIYENSDFKNRIMLHYQHSIDELSNQDAFPKATALLDSIRTIYPDSNQVAEKSRIIQIAKNQRLDQLTEQLKSCFEIYSNSASKLSHCLVTTQTKILKVGNFRQQSVSEIDQWFNQSILDSLNQKNFSLSSELLEKWAIIQKKDSPTRTVLRDAITIINPDTKNLSQIWLKLEKSEPQQRSKTLSIKPLREKFLAYITGEAASRAKRNNYSGVYSLLDNAVDIMKAYPGLVSSLQKTKLDIEHEQRKKIDTLNQDYLTKIRNCDPDQRTTLELIKKLNGDPLNDKNIDHNCIDSIRNAIIDNNSNKVAKQFENWKKLNDRSPPELNALTIANQIQFDTGKLPELILTLMKLPAELQQLVLDINPVQEKVLNYFNETAEKKITESGYPKTLKFLEEKIVKMSSHPQTVIDLQQLSHNIQKQQKREIVALLFEYRREILQCSDNIAFIQTQLDSVGAEREPFLGVDENCSQRLQEFLVKEDLNNAEKTLTTWKQLLPDNKTKNLLLRNRLSKKIADLKLQFIELDNLSRQTKLSLSSNDDIQLNNIITKEVNNLSPVNANRFWTKHERDLTDYYINKAILYLSQDNYDLAQKYCDKGLSIYEKSKKLLSECKQRVESQRNQKISKLANIFEDYMEKGWLVTGVEYRNGVVDILDAISKFDRDNHHLKRLDVHRAFENALLSAVKKMQIKEASELNDKWAEFLAREYISQEAHKLRGSANNVSAKQALSISRDLIQVSLVDQAKKLLELGLALKPESSISKQIEDELETITPAQ